MMRVSKKYHVSETLCSWKTRTRSSSPRARVFRVVICVLLLPILGNAWADENEPTYEFDIKAQAADLALTEFAEQADLTLVFPDELVREKKANELIGTYTLQQGAKTLLAGTGLTPEFSNEIVLSITTETNSADGGETMNTKKKAGLLATIAAVFSGGVNAQEAVDGDDESKAETPIEMEEIIVTGTNIRGVENPTVPILKFDSEYLEQSGYATTGEFFKDLPQNFAEFSPTTLAVVNQGGIGFNNSQGSNINLRGLGADATLVLLNGRRLVPAGSNAAVDISMIPLSALERVDILPDGGSAVYGSDAVAGVVNFVLQDDYEGAETSVRYSTPTRDGGGRTLTASQSIGANWDGGNALFAYEFRDIRNLTADERSFSAAASGFLLPELFDLTPSAESQKVLLNISHSPSSRLSFSGYGLYGKNDSLASRPIDPEEGLRTFNAESEQSSIALGLAYDISDSMVVEVGSTYNLTTSQEIDTVPLLSSISLINERDEASTVDAKISGQLLTLPGGPMRYAFGGEYRTQESSLTSGGDESGRSDRAQDRDVSSVFAEMVIPIFGPSNRKRFFEELQLSLAGRYDDISDAGSRSTPQVGLSWSPSDDLTFRSSYGESFKAPRFSQQTGQTVAVLLTGSDPTADDGRTPFILFSGSPLPGQLKPETAQTFSIGFDYAPQFLQNFTLSASYFNIEFDNRAGTPQVGGALSILEREGEIADVITRNPSQEEIARIVETATSVFNFSTFVGDPFVEFTATEAIVDVTTRNLARRDTSGIDVTARYNWDTAWGDFSLTTNMNYLTRLDQQDDPTAQIVELVDTLFNPVDFRARTGLTWSRDAFDASVFVDYVDSYENTDTDTTVDSWTTVDVRLAASIGVLFPQYAPAQGLELSLAVQNLFDTDPPFVESRSLFQPVGFDPINSDPYGRVVALQLTKQW